MLARSGEHCSQEPRAEGFQVFLDPLRHASVRAFRLDYQQQMGHVWLGFAPDTMQRYLAAAGFTDIRVRALPADAEAQGPALFAAVGRKAAA